MAYQPINLGTPNNNDGDSLYIGGTKINANFAEMYLNLAGSSSNTIKLNVGTTTPISSTGLFWSSAQQKFIPSSSNALRTVGNIGQNSLYITNNGGFAGNADNDLTSLSNTMQLTLESSNMLLVRARNNAGTAAGVRGSLEIGLGNVNVTSLSVYTTGTIIRALNGLSIYKATAEDTATNLRQLLGVSSTTTGITLYYSPTLDLVTLASYSPNVVNGTDSSAAIAHTGFVKYNLQNYPVSSTLLVGRRGIISTNAATNSTSNTLGNLSQDTYFNIDGIYHPKHMEGLIYNYNTINNQITLVTGAAAHWSYSTSGVAGIIPTTAIAIVASYNPIIRTFKSGWTPQYKTDGSTNAVIDATTSASTWYYLYYLGCLVYTSSFGTGVGNEFWPGSSNVVVSSNRDIASVDAQLAAAGYGGVWQTVRRVGPIRTNATNTGAIPFNVKRIDHGAFEYYWGLQPNAAGVASGADTGYTISVSTTGCAIVGSADTVTLAAYSSVTVTVIPPIPGITAFITVKHLPQAGLPALYLYGDSWTVNSSISALYPPFEVLRSMTTGLTNIHNIQVPMIPDGCYIPDGTYNGAGILSVTTSTGLKLRYIYQRPPNEGSPPVTTSSLLQFTVTGFRYAR